MFCVLPTRIVSHAQNSTKFHSCATANYVHRSGVFAQADEPIVGLRFSGGRCNGSGAASRTSWPKKNKFFAERAGGDRKTMRRTYVSIRKRILYKVNIIISGAQKLEHWSCKRGLCQRKVNNGQRPPMPRPSRLVLFFL